MGIYGRFHDEDFRQSISKIWDMEWKGPEEYAKERTLPIAISKAFCYFEGVGVLVSRHLIDIDLVEDLMGNHIVWVWEKIEPVVQELRKVINPKEADAVERLYNAIQEKRQHETVIRA